MKIPFCLPVIDDAVVDEMMDTLTNTGWLTTGPKTRALEEELAKFTGAQAALCVNSWTSGAMLMLRWFGVGPGDEVIIPSYTYSATALCVMNIGATPVMVDVKDDFTLDPDLLEAAITPKTKVIIPVDVAGWPCDYDRIYQIIERPDIRKRFIPASDRQSLLNRILVISDAAHSLGAFYKGQRMGIVADITIFSFHSVKNVTTGEGGGICLNLPLQFDHAKELAFLKAFSLNGQNKSAFEKNQIGGWRYDIIDQGMKVNMPDLCAAVGLAQIRKYENILLPERKEIFGFYSEAFSEYDWALLPTGDMNGSVSSCHLYMLRVKGITESQRDQMIETISRSGVGVNVHYIPMPMLTLFKNRGYRMENYPNTYNLYQNEITLPLYNGLNRELLKCVVQEVVNAYHSL